ncbi:hypothetical protein C4572_04120 [Candidatus Parcubacteria bacterium]|nr:MAG: hypothetical protein C4572_04120 [Candidatus Parcubacteria bacterium]
MKETLWQRKNIGTKKGEGKMFANFFKEVCPGIMVLEFVAVIIAGLFWLLLQWIKWRYHRKLHCLYQNPQLFEKTDLNWFEKKVYQDAITQRREEAIDEYLEEEFKEAPQGVFWILGLLIYFAIIMYVSSFGQTHQYIIVQFNRIVFGLGLLAYGSWVISNIKVCGFQLQDPLKALFALFGLVMILYAAFL